MKLGFAPGEKWKYSNTGYLLLGIIIRKASGTFYGDVLAERVFKPLGMTTTRVISEADIVPHRAAGYTLVKGELKNQSWVSPSLNTTADGALYFSVKDLVAWDAGVRAGRILKAASWASVFEPVRLNDGKTHGYGFGWADRRPRRPAGLPARRLMAGIQDPLRALRPRRPLGHRARESEAGRSREDRGRHRGPHRTRPRAGPLASITPAAS